MSAREAFDAATGVVAATWSDVTKIYRPSAGTWFNWLKEIDDGGLVLPFAVIAPLQARATTEFGLDVKAYYGGFAAWYVRSSRLTSAESSGGYDHVQQILEEKAVLLRDALLAYPDTAPTAPGFQIVEEPATDCSQLNPANILFHEKPYPYWSAMVTASILFGETY